MTAEVSHGRGGAGNINPDDTKYVDGEVVRGGVVGSHGDGAYSAGRGGAGNVGNKGQAATERQDHDIIPEAAVRISTDTGDFHTGRGGAGNEQHHHGNNGHGGQNGHRHSDKEGGAAAAARGAREAVATPVSLADKLKEKLFAAFK